MTDGEEFVDKDFSLRLPNELVIALPSDASFDGQGQYASFVCPASGEIDPERLRLRVRRVDEQTAKARDETIVRLLFLLDKTCLFEKWSNNRPCKVTELRPEVGKLVYRRFRVISQLFDLRSRIVRYFLLAQLAAIWRFVDPTEPGLTPTLFGKILVRLDGNIAKSDRMSDIAAEFDLSPSNFTRQFKIACGCNPHRYFEYCRLIAAHRYLAQSDKRIIDIAYLLGYSSQSHFTTAFGKLTGLPPGDYRDNQCQIIGSPS